ncbi:protein tramtrack, beta isoform isoform X2 [Tribolium castaneum]|uniref:protein tramtrack, beta isoform isoform X2 n=1 Tax=Tribolium castaneum TaxID=7070 RepID=UPI00046BFAD6|nr:PREDICTED: protein tramtrack, beta isoform isoform X2 [Tribolium castaneum]|eukprot:XP_008198841.1 PREDICTED: protein tramtrack, beta isoform isoform X2 [Tribolium castaneum]
MASEQFSLCWDNFHKNMSTGMNSLLENEDLVDVTLAVEGKYLKAHKMVLSVCSPYFRELFKVNPCKHPIVFMKDVSYVAMSDLLQFMYQGEVQVSQENLSTFIKTAEALQIKGLTGDGNGSAECDNEPEELKSVDVVEPPKLTPASRPRKTHPAPTPPAKRPRLNAPEASPTSAITKTEPSVSSTPTNDQLIQFKMEPYDQSQASITVPDDGVDETFADDPLDDTNADEGNEDYSMMEGGDDEPQAGTSTDGAAGEGQDFTIVNMSDKKFLRSGIFIDGFTYHQNTVKKSCRTRYLVCAEYKRLSCMARAQIPLGGNMHELVLRKEHNHPPYLETTVKGNFMTLLRTQISCRPTAPLKQIYECAAILHPDGAEICPFKKVATSMRRWRDRVMKQL